MLVTPATQSAVVVEQMQDTTVEAGDDAASGQVVADRVLPPGQSEQAAGADRPVHLDRRAVPGRGGSGGLHFNHRAIPLLRHAHLHQHSAECHASSEANV
jgi:hypothetical protein